ncbi:MAG: LysR family transcriptional regulator [Afipia felis]|nr:LysR family transcriptional regulator [Afipia felis]
MDTELARTFLTVVTSGSFVNAAEHLHVSQSTVSTRIHALEEHLGCALFVRNKAGTTLTAAGRQFQRHASTLVRTLELARHDVGLPPGFSGSLAIGGRIGLWEEFLLEWLPEMQRCNPTISIRAESGIEPEIMQGLIEGRLDIGVMYTPQSRPGLKIQQLFEERLVMVASSPDRPPHPQSDYVYVDWGPEFYTRHNTCFPDFTGSSLVANIGWLGLQHILKTGGAGYFPARMVWPFVKDGKLHIVEDAPEFFMPAYVVFAVERDEQVINDALSIMLRIADQNHGTVDSAHTLKRTRQKPAFAAE